MAKHSNSINDNPMAYFGKKSAKIKSEIGIEIAWFNRYLNAMVDNIVGLEQVKCYLRGRVQTIIFNKKRDMHGLSPISNDREAIILTGTGDTNRAIDHINTLLYAGKIKKSMTISDLDVESMPTLWEDKTRSNIENSVDNAYGTLLVIKNLDRLLHSTGEGAAYARYYLTRYLNDTINDHHLVIQASRATIQQWHVLCPDSQKINCVYVHCEKYTPDDLTAQFIKMARDGGYAVAPYVVQKISSVFSQLNSPVFRKTNFNNAASIVFNKCQRNQAHRIMQLPDEYQTARRMRSFAKVDLVSLIIAAENDVIAA